MHLCIQNEEVAIHVFFLLAVHVMGYYDDIITSVLLISQHFLWKFCSDSCWGLMDSSVHENFLVFLNFFDNKVPMYTCKI